MLLVKVQIGEMPTACRGGTEGRDWGGGLGPQRSTAQHSPATATAQLSTDVPHWPALSRVSKILKGTKLAGALCFC